MTVVVGFRFRESTSFRAKGNKEFLDLLMIDRSTYPERKGRLSDQGVEDDLRDTTVAERLEMVWQLTLDAWAFKGEPVEPRLPRHVVRLERRGG